MNEISIDKLGKLVVKLYKAGDRVSQLWIGKPGIGKSDMVRQIAKQIANEMGKEYVEYNDDMAFEILDNPEKYFVLVDLRLTEVEPSDLIGIPRDIDGAVAYKPLLWARVLNKVPGVLFLDELTNVQRPDVLSTSYKLLLDRKAGFIPFNKDVLVIAAGNSPDDSSIANMLPAPTINRVRVFRVKQPRLEDWKEWMDRTFGDDWDKRVYAFLSKNSNFFMMQPTDVETLNQFATPRTWTKLAEISHKVSESELEYITVATVGEEAGSHFTAFCRVDVPDLDEIIMNPEMFIELEEEAKYFVAVQLTSRLTEITRKNNKKGLDKTYNFLNYLLENNREFLILGIFMMNFDDRRKLGEWFLTDNKYAKIRQFLLNQAKITSVIRR